MDVSGWFFTTRLGTDIDIVYMMILNLLLDMYFNQISWSERISLEKNIWTQWI